MNIPIENIIKNSSPPLLWGKSFIDKLNLKETSTILDIGCRKGNLSAYLATRYRQKKWIAIDNVASEIEQAKTYQLPNLTFEMADTLQLDFTNTFDAVISLNCLHWIKNKYSVLKNIYQALKPGGKAYLQFFASHGRLKNDRFIYQTARSSHWKQYFDHLYPAYSEITAGECILMLQKAGFVIHELEFARYNTPFENSDALHTWLGTWAVLPVKKQDYFLNDVVHNYLAFHKIDNTSFPYHEYLLEIVCEKPIWPSSYHDTLQINLTKSEKDILKNYLQGKTAKEIAKIYAISNKTIEFHLANIKKKLNCYKRSDIYQTALKNGLIDFFL